jgi:hypothetical protein
MGDFPQFGRSYELLNFDQLPEKSLVKLTLSDLLG